VNPTGFIGRMSAEIMIIIALASFCLLWYMTMTNRGRNLMDRFDDWMGKILKRRKNG